MPSETPPSPTKAPATWPNHRGDRVARALLQVVDGGLAACIFVVPFLLGGRHPLGQFALVVFALVVAMAWTVRCCVQPDAAWRRSAAMPILLGASGLVVLQIVPLPNGLLAWLAPHTSEILPLWTAQGDLPARLGLWPYVSLTPAATESALVILLAYGLLFCVTVQRVQGVADVERLLRWCGLSALAMAGFGLVQLFTSNGKFFWLYEHPFSNTFDAAQGSFPNRNHFAHFLALGVGPFLWWVQDGLRRGRGAGLRWLGLGVILLAGLLSLSRGGAIVLLLAVAIGAAVCYRARTFNARLVVAFGAVAVLLGISLAVYGHHAVAARMDDLVSGSLDTLDGSQRRRAIWSAVASAASDFLVLGSGVGSHRWVYPIYLDPAARPGFVKNAGSIYFTHAENGPLQIALETGLPGAALLAAGIGLIGYWCVVALRRAGSTRAWVAAGAISAAMVASLVHSLVDFVWYVPACTAMVAMLAACACRLHQLTASEAARTRQCRPLSRRFALAMTCVLVAASAWMVDSRARATLAEPHWHAYQMMARASFDRRPCEGEPLAPVDGETASASADVRDLPAAVRKMVAELEQVVRWDPTRAEAHLELARVHLLLFAHAQETSSNAMPLSAIRGAAVESHFRSRQELDAWLAGAIGEHARHLDAARRHARRGLALCPVEGSGYLHLAQLSFLDGGDAAASRAAMAQALTLRPFDGSVLIAAGQEAALAGELDRGIEYWRRAYRSGRVHQDELVRRLASRVAPDDPERDIAFFLGTFDPDLAVLRQLEAIYLRDARPEQTVLLRRRHAAAAEAEASVVTGVEAAARWMEARLLHLGLNDFSRAAVCLENAAREDPNNQAIRCRLVTSLVDRRRYQEARGHLAWCLARKPDDPSLIHAAREIAQNEVQQRRSALTADRRIP